MRATAIVVVFGLLAGCATWSRLFGDGEQTGSPPPAVVELVASAAADAPVPAFTQYWSRNTLVIDISSAGSVGRMMLAPRPGSSWPVRLAFRVGPGFGALEVRGAQRIVLPVSQEASQPLELELPPGIYTQASERVEVLWGPIPAATDQSPGG
jgi:hypothetical protein